jgi:DNA-binding response OmpR family regulator
MPKVLLLDTEPHLFALFKSKLEREGFEVLTDESALSPLAPHASSPDLIILDQRHYDPGFVLPHLGTPVILLSSSDSEEEGEFPQLKMPFRPNDLVALARRTVAF